MPNLMDRLLDAAAAWERRFSNKFLIDTVNRMNALADESGLTRREIADRAGWKESYLSRVLSGQQNLTLRSLAKFEEAVGGQDVLVVTGASERPAPQVRISSMASQVTRIASHPETRARVSEALDEYDKAGNDYSYALALEAS